MIRPMTSDVSALSGGVAKSHQAIHFVSSAPSKIPYGGFSPVRLQASLPDVTFRDAPAPRYRHPPSWSGVHPLPVRFIGLAPHPNVPNADSDPLAQWPLAPPVVMLSTGLIAYYGHIRASAPHRRFPILPTALAAQKVPTFISQSLMTCRRPYSDGSRESRTNLNSRLGLRPFGRGSATMLYPHTGPRVVAFTKLQRSLNAAARHLACPAPDGAFTTELACPGSLQRQVGHHYRNVRLIPDRTFTGCSVSFVGCTPNEPMARRAVQSFRFKVQSFGNYETKPSAKRRPFSATLSIYMYKRQGQREAGRENC